MKVIVLGVGNILLSDEGVGVRAIETLREKYDFPDSIDVIDGGTMGLDLLPFIEGKDRVLLIDAVNVNEPPGTIVKIEGCDIPKFLSQKMSVHQIGLPDMLCAANLTGILPNELFLVGIQPKTMDTGLSLSDDIMDRMDCLVEIVITKLREWDVPIKEKAGALY